MPKMTIYRALRLGQRRQPGQPAPGRTERAAMAYGELTTGTLEEYEAIESTVMNRVASGEKQWVQKNGAINEHNVVIAKHPNQYQAVKPDDKGSNYEKYLTSMTNDSGTHNAMLADDNLRRTEKPTTNATSFVVHEDGSPPTDHEIMNMGNVKAAEPNRVKSLSLYID